MNADRIRRKMERDYERFNAHDFSWLEQDVTDDYVDHEDSDRYGSGAEGTERRLSDFVEAFPDARFEPIQIIASHEYGVALIRMTGTQRGAFMGLEPTGRRIEVDAADVIRVAPDGKVAEHWSFFDRLQLLGQLGAAPEPRSTMGVGHG